MAEIDRLISSINGFEVDFVEQEATP